MNRFLADTLSMLNVVTAALIIMVSFVIGSVVGGIWLFLVPAFGVLVAAVGCGVIAFLALIEQHLSILAERAGVPSTKSMESGRRVDPEL